MTSQQGSTAAMVGLRVERGQRIGRPLGRRVVAVAAGVLAFVSTIVAPASAAAPVPRFLPAKVPASYSYNDYIDRTTPSSTIRYMRYLRNGANTAAAVVLGEPGQKSDWDSFARVLKNAGFTATKVKGLSAWVDGRDGIRTYYWFEKNRIITSKAINVAPALHKALNTAVVVTKLPDASFALKKEPAGLATVYAGSSAALIGSFSRVYWADERGNELTLDVSAIDRRALEVYLLSPFVTYGTTTVRGKPAYVIEDDSYTEVWWEEQPGLLMEVTADDLTAPALVEIADSIAPTDEATWQAFVATPTQGSGSGASKSSGVGDIVGAGMAEGVPWTAKIGESASCLQFTIGVVSNQSCIKSPNSFGWSTINASGKTFALGVAAANVTTVIARSSTGAELGRTAVGPVSGQPVLRLFVLALPGGTTGATIAGLDATGAEAFPAIGAGA